MIKQKKVKSWKHDKNTSQIMEKWRKNKTSNHVKMIKTKKRIPEASRLAFSVFYKVVDFFDLGK